MIPTTTRAAVMPRANPVLSALMMLSLAVYAACLVTTLLAALAGHETRRTPLLTREPREIQIGPPRGESGPEIKHGAAVVALTGGFCSDLSIGGVR